MSLNKESLRNRKKRKLQIHEMELPDGEKVHYVVRKLHDVRDVIDAMTADASGQERMDAVATLLARSIVDTDGVRILEDDEKEELLEAFEPAVYGELARSIQRGYGLLKTEEEVAADLTEAPGE